MTTAKVMDHNIELVCRMLQAGNDADPDALRACYMEDAVFDDLPTEQVYNGREALLKVVSHWWASTSGLHIEPQHWITTETHVTVQWTLNGTFTKPIPDLPGADPRGKKFSVRGVSIVEFSDTGLISRHTDYWNMATLLAQIGTNPLG